VRVALLLAPLFEGATPGDPFAWVETAALPMPGETIAHAGTVYVVAMHAFTVKQASDEHAYMEFGLMVRRIGAVPKLAGLSDAPPKPPREEPIP